MGRTASGSRVGQAESGRGVGRARERGCGGVRVKEEERGGGGERERGGGGGYRGSWECWGAVGGRWGRGRGGGGCGWWWGGRWDRAAWVLGGRAFRSLGRCQRRRAWVSSRRPARRRRRCRRRRGR